MLEINMNIWVWRILIQAAVLLGLSLWVFWNMQNTLLAKLSFILIIPQYNDLRKQLWNFHLGSPWLQQLLLGTTWFSILMMLMVQWGKEHFPFLDNFRKYFCCYNILCFTFYLFICITYLSEKNFWGFLIRNNVIKLYGKYYLKSNSL